MNRVSTSPLSTDREQADCGFSLIELIIAVVLSLLIGGVVVAALITSLNVSDSTTSQVGNSTDAGFITAYLTRDAQSAGGIVPTTALKDTTVGVSIVSTGWAGCTQGSAALVVRFSWMERTSTLAQNTVVVTYGFDSVTATLTRRLCLNGATTGTDVVLGRSIASAVASCSSACTGAPAFVNLVVTGKGIGTPLAYTLKASLRGDSQPVLAAGNTTPLPLLARGAGASVACPNVEIAGSGVVTVVGNALVDSQCLTGAPIKDDAGLLRPTGTKSTVAGIVDPYAGRAKPSTTCATTGTNPSTIGVSTGPSLVVKYPQPVNITADTLFQPGRFMFCQGLTFTNGLITGTNVLLYIATGTFEVKAAATVNMTGQTTNDKQMLVWSFEPNKPIKIAGGSRVSSYRGLIYAPTSRMELSSVLGGNVGSINTQGLKVTGAGQSRIGLSMPVIAVAPATTLSGGQANVAYSNSTLVASGGTAPYTWSATGLPAPLEMSATGVITGTPMAASTATAGTPTAIIVTVFDATKASASFDYSLTINPSLAIGTASLPNGQVGVGYSAPVVSSGGTAPYAWSAVSGMPPGLSISGAGTISGTPTLAGTYNVTVTVTDAFTSATTTYSNVVIIGSIAIDGPALPNGQVGTTYGPTTISATGGTPPYTWTWTGAPPGLALNPSTGAVTGKPTMSGAYSVIMTATDTVGTSAQATYPVTISMPACPSTNPPWKAQYYPTATLSGTPVLRDDADINFNWGAAAPIAGIPANNFSVRWTRTTNFAAGSYTFLLNTDDGSRMYIDDVLIAPLNNWTVAQSTSYTQFLTGWHTIKVEYNEKSGSARASLATTFVAAAQVPSNGVTASPYVSNNQPYFGELNLTLNNPSDVILAMSMSFTVAQTPGVSYHGQYTTIPNSDMIYSHETCGLVAYAFTLEQGLTIRTPGSWILAAQWDGTGTPRVTSGDTWSVTTLTSKGTTTLTGTFP